MVHRRNSIWPKEMVVNYGMGKSRLNGRINFTNWNTMKEKLSMMKNTWQKIGRKFRTKNNVNDHAALVDYKN